MTEHTPQGAQNPGNGGAERHDALASAAVAEVQSGMLVGLGTGRNSDRAIRALAMRVRAEKLDIDCVCTSLATEMLAQELGLPIVPFAEIEEVDLLIDGAIEVDGKMRMLKGQQGAITRQRLVAEVSRRRIYMCSEDKVSEQIGQKALLALTIIPFGIASIRNRLRDMGLCGVLRHALDGEVFVTDGGGVVLDCRMDGRDAEELAEQLDHVTGVVDHGIFLDEADEILIECKGGDVRRLVRAEVA